MITVELTEECSVWLKNRAHVPHNKIVDIRIEYGEVELGRKVKSFGGIWNKEKRLWELSYGHVCDLGLKDRIINK